MGILFSGSELIDIALGIEKNGVAFYDSLAESTRSEKAREVYRHLAGEERKHIEIFQDMLAPLAGHHPPETYTEEYDLYLKSLVDAAIFNNEHSAREMAKQAASEIEAIQIALGAEKDSILFYSEIRDVVRRTNREMVYKIIEEERSHLRQLLQLKNGFART